jgi:hypothetical protein
MRRAAFLVASFLATAAVAQTATDGSKAPEKAPERPRLNLKLENPSSFARITPPEKEPEKDLPGLGSGASKSGEREFRIPIEPSSPFPKDTNPGK